MIDYMFEGNMHEMKLNKAEEDNFRDDFFVIEDILGENRYKDTFNSGDLIEGEYEIEEPINSIDCESMINDFDKKYSEIIRDYRELINDNNFGRIISAAYEGLRELKMKKIPALRAVEKTIGMPDFGSRRRIIMDEERIVNSLREGIKTIKACKERSKKRKN